MALVYIDGCDHYNIADIGKKCTYTAPAYSTASMDTGRLGSGQSYKAVGTAAAASNTGTLSHVFPTGGLTDGGMGFAIKLSSIPPDGYFYNEIAGVYNAATGTQLTLRLAADGTLAVYRGGGGGTELGSGGSLVGNAWNYVEWKWHLAGTTNGTATIQINGIVTATITGVNTLAGGTGFTSAWVGGGQYLYTRTVWFDDIYMFDSTAGVTDLLGDITVTTKLVTANGTTNNGTASAGANFECVDEALADTADYVTIADVNDIELYATEDVGTGTVIHAVQVTAFAQRTEDGSAALAAEIRQGGANYAHPTPQAVTVNYTFKPFIYENDALDDPWTDTVFNAVEFGVIKTE